MDDSVAHISYQDMLKMIDNKSGDKIMKIIGELESPFHAMCTLASCLGLLTTFIVEEVPAAEHNIDEMAEFSKNIAQKILEYNKKLEEKETETTSKH